MSEENQSEKCNKIFDRPIECSDCRRPIVVHYTEMVEKKCHCFGMCSECPQVEKKLQANGEKVESLGDNRGELVCGECGTTLEEIKRGVFFGCSLCYDVFAGLILDDIIAPILGEERLVRAHHTSESVHVGRQLGEVQDISPSVKLIALNEALDDTLKREDYEQAAWLRDQINKLTRREDGKKK